MRHEFPRKIKAQAALRAQGKCERCGTRLRTGYIEYDHEIPDYMGGAATLENCVCVCRSCHAHKTAKVDAPRIAKTRRNFRKAHGIKKKSRFPGARNSRWKKKLNGEVVER
jgi:5-methylcytosine-specific restriction endonuclease McrA